LIFCSYFKLCRTPSAALPLTVAKGGELPLIALEEVSISVPKGVSLASGLSLQVHAGDRVFIQGPNASGKSSLLRVLLGTWPVGAGQLYLAQLANQALVLPQRPYLAGATLKEQLVYPVTAAASTTDPPWARRAWECPDETILAALRWAGLETLAPNAAALHAMGRTTGLSGGEAQRLGAARLWLACQAGDEPLLAMLDEPSSACEPVFEQKLFAFCAAQPHLTLLTIAHRPEVAAYHTHRLQFDGAGGASFSKI